MATCKFRGMAAEVESLATMLLTRHSTAGGGLDDDASDDAEEAGAQQPAECARGPVASKCSPAAETGPAAEVQQLCQQLLQQQARARQAREGASGQDGSDTVDTSTVRARKAALATAVAASSSSRSATAAAAQEALAGSQDRLKCALGLRPSASGSTTADSRTSGSGSASGPAVAAAHAPAAELVTLAPGPRTLFLDSADEVAEMAARLMKRRGAAAAAGTVL